VAMHWKLNIRLFEKVVKVSKTKDGFQVKTDKAIFQSKAIIISTGFYDIPNLLNIPGEGLSKVHHYYREPHFYYGQKLVVIGSANSAVDVALETWRKGASVTMVIREKQIGENVKYWVRPDMENRIKNGEIKAYFKSHITAVRENEVDIKTPKGKLTIPNDFVLAMTGYLPDFSLLQQMGIKLGADKMKTPVHNPDTMETNVPGIYLAGVICGGMQTNKWFIENSRYHADKILGHYKRVVK
jgi:thioredoxin reductase (NADPH)